MGAAAPAGAGRATTDLKICVGASAGGHMNQLLKLLEQTPSWARRIAVCVTTLESLAGKLAAHGKVYVIGECNRRHPFKALACMFRSLRLVAKERPDVIVTTGSLPLGFVCLFTKLFGGKVVWIDSVANIQELSLTGRMIRPIADLFLTQWPDIAERYDDVEFAGAIV